MAVNPMDPSGKDKVLEVLRNERAKFYEVIDNPENWNVQTRAELWQVRDMVYHMIDVTEGYLNGWDKARNGEDPIDAVGTGVMGETLHEHVKALRDIPRDEAIARLKTTSDKMLEIFDSLTADEWNNFLVGHFYMGPLPTFFYPGFQVMDYGIHTWDMHWGLGDKDAKLDEAAAGVLVPFMFVLYKYTVEPKSAEGVDVVYGIDVAGEWGGKWIVTVKDGQFDSEPAEDLSSAQAVYQYDHVSDFVLTAFQRKDMSNASGDEEVIRQVNGLFFTI